MRISEIIGLCLIVFAWSMSATIVHVIPLYYDQATKKWEVMLSRNAGTAMWTDFDNDRKENPQQVAAKTIHDFTRGRYNEKNTPLKSAIDLVQYGQHFWLVPVTSRVKDSDMRKARNQEKRDFLWIPMEQVLGFDMIKDRRRKKSGYITIDHNLRETLRILWPNIQKRLAKKIH